MRGQLESPGEYRLSEVVGNVLETHGIREITIILREGKRLPLGSFVYVLDEGIPIVYQVVSPTYDRRASELDKRLIVKGKVMRDDLYVYVCRGVLVGKVYEDGRIEPPKYPIPPLSEVYEIDERLVRMVIEPPGHKVRIGVNPLTNQPVFMDLRQLIRQGLLISGAQGTGKTTALLTLIVRSIEAFSHLRFLVLDWTGEFRSLRKCDVIVDSLTWDEALPSLIAEDPTTTIEILRSEDPRVRGAVEEVLFTALVLCRKRGVYPTKERVRAMVGSQGRDFGGNRSQETISTAINIVENSEILPEREPNHFLKSEDLIEKIMDNNVVVIDFTRTKRNVDGFEIKKRMASFLAKCVWERASRDERFGCIVVSDEAHRIAPERSYGGDMDGIWLRLATEGGRNGCPLWLVARRLSLVSKAVTTELQQNFICFNVEDVDRKRIAEDLGETFSDLLGTLPPGEALVKSAAGFRIPGEVVHVRFDKVVEPSSVNYGLEEKFLPVGSKNASTIDRWIT